MLLINLFLSFLQIGLFGFGGGYAMIPLMEQANRQHDWIPQQQFTDIIAIAGSSPGPIATNAALFIGYQTAGTAGAVIAVCSSLLPSFIIVLLIMKTIADHSHLKAVGQCLYGIHPVIAALILYAGILMSNQIQLFSYPTAYPQYFILIFSIVLLAKKVSPVWVICSSGVLGMLIYGY